MHETLLPQCEKNIQNSFDKSKHRLTEAIPKRRYFRGLSLLFASWISFLQFFFLNLQILPALLRQILLAQKSKIVVKEENCGFYIRLFGIRRVERDDVENAGKSKGNERRNSKR